MNKIYILLLLTITNCSQSELDEKWLNTLNSTVFFTKDNKQLIIEDNGNVKVPRTDSGEYTFIFNEAKSETEAYYKEYNKSGYTGLKFKDGELYQVGTKSDSTSGASLSSKKDFISFSKIIKTLGTAKK